MPASTLTRPPAMRRLLLADREELPEPRPGRPGWAPPRQRFQDDPIPGIPLVLRLSYGAAEDEDLFYRRHWRYRRQDGGGNLPLRVSKFLDYPVLTAHTGSAVSKLESLPVLAAPGGSAVSKLESLPVLAAPGGSAVSKLVTYAILQPTPPPVLPAASRAPYRIIASDDSAEWAPIQPRWVRQPMLGPPPPYFPAPARWQLRVIQADDSAEWAPVFQRRFTTPPDPTMATPWRRLAPYRSEDDETPSLLLRRLRGQAQGASGPALTAPAPMRRLLRVEVEEDYPRRRLDLRQSVVPAIVVTGTEVFLWVNT